MPDISGYEGYFILQLAHKDADAKLLSDVQARVLRSQEFLTEEAANRAKILLEREWGIELTIANPIRGARSIVSYSTDYVVQLIRA